MLQNLFSSKILFSILSFLFQSRTGRIYATPTTEIIRATGKNQANVLRELEKLSKWGIVKKSKSGNQNYYQLNNDFVYHNQLANLFSEYNLKNQTTKYFLTNEEGGATPLPINFFLRGFYSNKVAEFGILPKAMDVLGHYKNNYAWFHFEKKSWVINTKVALKKLLTDPSFVRKISLPVTLKKGQEAFDVFGSLKKKNFKVSTEEAVSLIDKFSDIITTQISVNSIAVLDLRDYPYTNYLTKYLEPKVKKAKQQLNVVMEKLLAPNKISLTQQMRMELLRLAINSRCHSDSFCHPERSEQSERSEGSLSHYKFQLQQIHQNWCWLNYGYNGPALPIEFFNETLQGLLKQETQYLEKELSDIEHQEEITETKKQAMYKILNIDKKHQNFIDALSLLSYLKVYRKDIAFLLIYLLYIIIEQHNQLFKREQLSYLTIEEVKQMILGQLKTTRSDLIQRMSESVHIASDENKIYVGDKAREIFKQLVEKEDFDLVSNGQRVKLLEGTTACLGKTGDWIYGQIKIVNSLEDMVKMKNGDILVSVATTPDIVPAMKRAGAIVTDQGGITSHAGIVSRELNIPCLIGTKYATKLFKDGDKVVVCPRHGYVKFQ